MVARLLAALGLGSACLILAASTVTAAGPTPVASPTPPANQSTPSPPPPDAQLNLSPPSGAPGTTLTISGSQFNPNQHLALYWNDPDTPIKAIQADSSGSFTLTYQVPSGPVNVYKVCVAEVPLACAQFTMLVPSPSPSPAGSPTPSASPTTSPSPASTPAPLGNVQPPPGTSATAMLLRPPFVIFPILAIVAALLALVLWLRSREPSGRPLSASVIHRSQAPLPLDLGGPGLPQPSEWEAPSAPPEVPSPPAAPPAAAAEEPVVRTQDLDEPPDLPQAGE